MIGKISHDINTFKQLRLTGHFILIFVLLTCQMMVFSQATARNEVSTSEQQAGFSFDCDNTPAKPCRKLIAREGNKSIKVESSSATWSERHQKVIIVSDNFNDLVEQDAGHYVIAYFELNDEENIQVEPLLSQEQVKAFRLYDLEGVTLKGERLYAIGSLALHGKDPKRDNWERHQFLQMELVEKNGRLRAVNLSHVASRWPNFRDWMISKSGHEWTGDATRGRAEGAGINVEALSITTDGNLLIGFRGPLNEDGGALALEIKLPDNTDDEPVLVKKHKLPPVDLPLIPKGAAKTLRAITMIPDERDQFYVLLGPIGYEKEELVIARWNSATGALSKVTLLPRDFVAEGATLIPGGRIMVVDDLNEMVLFATEN